MTSPQFEYPTRPGERPGRARGARSALPASRARRTGMVSEAVVAGYIRDLAAHGRRIHGVARPRAERRRTVTG